MSSIDAIIQPLHPESRLPEPKQAPADFAIQPARPTLLSFASPTDNLMSPCTLKLQAHRQKFLTRRAPRNNVQSAASSALASFAASATPASRSNSLEDSTPITKTL